MQLQELRVPKKKSYLPVSSSNFNSGKKLFITIKQLNDRTIHPTNVILFADGPNRFQPSPHILCITQWNKKLRRQICHNETTMLLSQNLWQNQLLREAIIRERKHNNKKHNKKKKRLVINPLRNIQDVRPLSHIYDEMLIHTETQQINR